MEPKKFFIGIMVLLTWAIVAIAMLATGAVTSTQTAMGQATKFTFSHSVRLPGRVLPAGTYWFVMANNADKQKVVEIYNSDGTPVIGNVMIESAEKLAPHSHAYIILTQPAGVNQPPAVITWFFPGTLEGDRFVYGEREQRRINEERKVRYLVDEGGVISEKELEPNRG
jgi:hypothetical protein